MNYHSDIPQQNRQAPDSAARMQQFEEIQDSQLRLKWATLHEVAGVVGLLAGSPAEAADSTFSSFPILFRAASRKRKVFFDQGLDDLLAIMQPGIATLLTLHASRGDPAPAAMALWKEFHSARAALLDTRCRRT